MSFHQYNYALFRSHIISKWHSGSSERGGGEQGQQVCNFL